MKKSKNVFLFKLVLCVLMQRAVCQIYFAAGDVPVSAKYETNNSFEFTMTVWVGIVDTPLPDPGPIATTILILHHSDEPIRIQYKTDPAPELVIGADSITNTFSTTADTEGYRWVFINLTCWYDFGILERSCDFFINDGLSTSLTVNTPIANPETTVEVIYGNESVINTIPFNYGLFDFQWISKKLTPGVNEYYPMSGNPYLIFLVKPYLDTPYTKVFTNLVDSDMGDLINGQPNDFSFNTNLVQGAVTSSMDWYQLPSIKLKNSQIDGNFTFLIHAKAVIKSTIPLTSINYNFTLRLFTYRNHLTDHIIKIDLLIDYDLALKTLQTVTLKIDIDNNIQNTNLAFTVGGGAQTAEINIDFMMLRFFTNIFDTGGCGVKVACSLNAGFYAYMNHIPSSDDSIIIGSTDTGQTFSDSINTANYQEDVAYIIVNEIAIFGGAGAVENISPDLVDGYGRIGRYEGDGYIIACPTIERLKRYGFNGNDFTQTCNAQGNLNTNSISNCYSSSGSVCHECEPGFILNADNTCTVCPNGSVYDILTKQCFADTETTLSGVGQKQFNLTQNANLQYLTDINDTTTGYNVMIAIEIDFQFLFRVHSAYADTISTAYEDADKQIYTFNDAMYSLYPPSNRKVRMTLKYAVGMNLMSFYTELDNSNDITLNVAVYDFLRNFSYYISKNIDCKDSSNRKFVYNNFYTGHCDPSCPDGTFEYDGNSGRCYNCSEVCATCDSYYRCTSCVSGFYLYQHICMPCADECDGCFTFAFNCLACSDPNHVKTTVGTVSLCAPPGAIAPEEILNDIETAMDEGSNVLTEEEFFEADFSGGCDEGDYLDPVTITCTPCVAPCIVCLNDQICLECEEPARLILNKCQTGGTGGAGASSSMFFNESEFGSQRKLVGCASSVSDICMICESGYYHTPDQKCGKCMDGCAECDDDIFCHACGEGFTLTNNKCEKSCEASQYRKNGNCESCNDCDDCLNCPSCLKCFQSVGYSLIVNPYSIEVHFLNDLDLNIFRIDEGIEVVDLLGDNSNANGGEPGQGGGENGPHEGQGEQEEGRDDAAGEMEEDRAPPAGENEEEMGPAHEGHEEDTASYGGEGEGTGSYGGDPIGDDPLNEGPVPRHHKRRVKMKLKKRTHHKSIHHYDKNMLNKLSHVVQFVNLDDNRFGLEDGTDDASGAFKAVLHGQIGDPYGGATDDPLAGGDPYGGFDDPLLMGDDPYGGAGGFEGDPYANFDDPNHDPYAHFDDPNHDPYGGAGPEGEAYEPTDQNIQYEMNEGKGEEVQETDAEAEPEDPTNIMVYSNDYIEIHFIDCVIEFSTLNIIVETNTEKVLKIEFYDNSANGGNFIDENCSTDMKLTKKLFSKLRDCNLNEDISFKSKIKKDEKLDQLQAQRAGKQATAVMSNTSSTGMILIGLGFKQILNSFLVLLNSMNLIDLLPLMQFKYDDQSNTTIGKLTFSFDFYFNYTNDEVYYSEFQSKVNGLYPKALQLKGNAYANQTSFKFLMFVFGFFLLFLRKFLNKVRKEKLGPRVNSIFDYFIGFSDSFILSDSIDFIAHFCLQYKYINQSGVTPLYMFMTWLGVFLLTYGWLRTFDINKKVRKKDDFDNFVNKYEFFFPYVIPNYTRAYYFNTFFILRNVVVTMIAVIFFDTYYYSLTVILIIQAAFVYFNYLIYKKMTTIPVFSGLYSEICILVIFFGFLFIDFFSYDFYRIFIVFIYFSFSGFSMLGMVYSAVMDSVQEHEEELGVGEEEEPMKELAKEPEKLFAKVEKKEENRRSRFIDFIDQEDEYDPRVHTYGSSKTNSEKDNKSSDNL